MVPDTLVALKNTNLIMSYVNYLKLAASLVGEKDYFESDESKKAAAILAAEQVKNEDRRSVHWDTNDKGKRKAADTGTFNWDTAPTTSTGSTGNWDDPKQAANPLKQHRMTGQLRKLQTVVAGQATQVRVVGNRARITARVAKKGLKHRPWREQRSTDNA